MMEKQYASVFELALVNECVRRAELKTRVLEQELFELGKRVRALESK